MEEELMSFPVGMKKKFFADEIQSGSSFDDVFMVDDIAEKKKKNGETYYSMVLRDRTGTVDAKIWDAPPEIPRRGDFVKVRAVAGTYKDAIQLTITQIRPLHQDEGIAMEDFVPVGPHNRFEQIKNLADLIADISHPGLRAICQYVVTDPSMHMDFRDAPAASGNHHAYMGGLLEHVLSMCSTVAMVHEHYGVPDPSLLYAACIFHDIGKTRELIWKQGLGYSAEGGLVGHIAIGLEILEGLRSVYWAAVAHKEIGPTPGNSWTYVADQDRDMWNHLRHIVASHHGQISWGAVKCPMTREAMLFHLIDMMDSNMGKWANIDKETVDNDGMTGWIKGLEGGRAWRPK